MKSNSEEEDEKPRDVVHVRARRGQATDSHSLAERVYLQIIINILNILLNTLWATLYDFLY